MPLDVKSDCRSVTVRVYETPRKGYPSWTVAHRFGGQRVRKRFASLDDAKDHAKTIANSIANGRTSALDLSAADLASCARAMELAKSTGKPLELVAAEYARAWAILGDVPVERAAEEYRRNHPAGGKMVSEILTEFLETKGKCDPDYRRIMAMRLARFAEAFQCTIASVTAAALADWLEKMKGGARTKRNAFADVKALVRFAIRRRYLRADFDELTRVDLPAARPGRIQPYSPEEMRKILNHAQGEAIEFLPYLPVRAFSGVRFKEMGRLRPEHFHRSGWISMDAEITKTHSRRLVPILPVLKRWLARYPVTDKLLPFSVSNMGPRLPELIHAAGVKPRRNGLRDSYVSYRMAALQDAGKVAEETGHSVEVMRRSYREIRMPDGRVITPKEARRWFDLNP